MGLEVAAGALMAAGLGVEGLQAYSTSVASDNAMEQAKQQYLLKLQQNQTQTDLQDTNALISGNKQFSQALVGMSANNGGLSGLRSVAQGINSNTANQQFMDLANKNLADINNTFMLKQQLSQAQSVKNNAWLGFGANALMTGASFGKASFMPSNNSLFDFGSDNTNGGFNDFNNLKYFSGW